jgi:hypothetical protein
LPIDLLRAEIEHQGNEGNEGRQEGALELLIGPSATAFAL